MWNCDIHSISTNYVNRVQPRYNFHNRAMNRGIYPEITVDDREIKKAPTEGECNKQEVLREALKDYISDTMGKVDDETVDRVLDFTAIYLALLGGQKDEQ